MRDASGTRTVSKRAHEACHVTAILRNFQGNVTFWGAQKAQFFLASQGRRLRPARPCASRPARPRFPDLTWFCSHIFEFRHYRFLSFVVSCYMLNLHACAACAPNSDTGYVQYGRAKPCPQSSCVSLARLSPSSSAWSSVTSPRAQPLTAGGPPARDAASAHPSMNRGACRRSSSREHAGRDCGRA